MRFRNRSRRTCIEQIKEQNKLLLGNAPESGSDSSKVKSGKPPASLTSLREEFLDYKRTTTKKDGTPLDDETITAYDQQTAELVANCKAKIPTDVTGMDLRRYMAALRERGMSHRTVCNNYPSIATFLKFCGIDHNSLLPYNERPSPDDDVPESYSEQEIRAFFAALNEERHRLFFEFMYKVGCREREATTLEWLDLNLGKEPFVRFQVRKPHFEFRIKTGKGRVV